MALNLTTDIQTRDGFTVANAYGRVAVYDQYVGNNVESNVQFYISKQAFDNGATPLKTNYMQDSVVPYDRATDGTDILNIAHNGLIAELAKQGITATKDLT